MHCPGEKLILPVGFITMKDAKKSMVKDLNPNSKYQNEPQISMR
jgi:hypothetical protein